jgi:hypothetical protein
MERPEKITRHHIGDNGEQHEKNRNPENPTVVHSPPAGSTIPVMFMTMLSFVHTKQI